MSVFSRAMLALAFVLLGPLTATAAPKAAVLPFEMHIDLQMDGMSLYGLPPKPKKAEQQRLERVRTQMIEMLEADNAYEIVDISDMKSDIRRAAPFDACDGCEVAFGKKANADVTLLGVVRKHSELMINIAIYERDVASGKLKKSMAASVLQNDDQGWWRAVRHMVKNRLVPAKAISETAKEPK